MQQRTPPIKTSSLQSLIRTPPNSAILDASLDHEEEEKMALHYPPRIRRYPNIQFQLLTFLLFVKRWRDFDPNLPAPQSAQETETTKNPRLRNVYAVSRSDLTTRAVVKSLLHWSIYCDGYVYHLGADSASDLYYRSGSKDNSASSLPRFKMDKCHLDTNTTVEGVDFAKRHHKPLVAYHIGQTDLVPAQIQTIGEWLIARMEAYDFVKSNCQHFLLMLAMRILCRRRNFTVFVGTLAQIAKWDGVVQQKMMATATEGDDEHENGFSKGFLLRKPLNPYPFTICRRLYSFDEIRTVEAKAYHITELWYGLGTDSPPPRDVSQCQFLYRQLLLWPALRRIIVRKEDRQSLEELEKEGVYVCP